MRNAPTGFVDTYAADYAPEPVKGLERGPFNAQLADDYDQLNSGSDPYAPNKQKRFEREFVDTYAADPAPAKGLSSFRAPPAAEYQPADLADDYSPIKGFVDPYAPNKQKRFEREFVDTFAAAGSAAKGLERGAPYTEAPESTAADQLQLRQDSDFASQKGRLHLPATGTVMTTFKPAHIVKDGSGTYTAKSAGGRRTYTTEDDPVRSAADGTVVFAGFMRGYNNVVIVRYGKDYLAAYMNNKEDAEGEGVKEGDYVRKGAVIGKAAGGEVNFQLSYKGVIQDPSNWFEREGKNSPAEKGLARGSFKATPPATAADYATSPLGDSYGHLDSVADPYDPNQQKLFARGFGVADAPAKGLAPAKATSVGDPEVQDLLAEVGKRNTAELGDIARLKEDEVAASAKVAAALEKVRSAPNAAETVQAETEYAATYKKYVAEHDQPAPAAAPAKGLTPVQLLAPAPAKGVVEKGNIDLNNRPVVKNADGRISTVRSMGVNIDGVEVLIPTVVNGKVVSEKAAIDHYKTTGEHLGKFDSVAESDKYAQKLHEDQANQYSGESEAPLKRAAFVDTYAQPAGKRAAFVDTYDHKGDAAFVDTYSDGWRDVLTTFAAGAGSMVAGIGAVIETPGTTFMAGVTGVFAAAHAFLEKHGGGDKPGDSAELKERRASFSAALSASAQKWLGRNVEERKTPHAAGTFVKDVGNRTEEYWREEISPSVKARVKALGDTHGAIEWLQAVRHDPGAFGYTLVESTPATFLMLLPGMGLNKFAELASPLIKGASESGLAAAAKVMAAGGSEAEVVAAAKQAVITNAQKSVSSLVGSASIVSEGVLSAGSAQNDVAKRIAATPEDKLIEQSPAYSELRKTHPPKEAREILTATAGSMNAVINLFGDMFASKLVGGGHATARIIQSNIPSKRSVVKVINREGLEGAGQGLAEEGGQYTGQRVDDPAHAKFDPSKAAVSGYVSEAAMSVGPATVSHIGSRYADRPVDLLQPDVNTPPPQGGQSEDGPQRVPKNPEAAWATYAPKGAAAWSDLSEDSQKVASSAYKSLLSEGDVEGYLDVVSSLRAQQAPQAQAQAAEPIIEGEVLSREVAPAQELTPIQQDAAAYRDLQAQAQQAQTQQDDAAHKSLQAETLKMYGAKPIIEGGVEIGTTFGGKDFYSSAPGVADPKLDAAINAAIKEEMIARAKKTAPNEQALRESVLASMAATGMVSGGHATPAAVTKAIDALNLSPTNAVAILSREIAKLEGSNSPAATAKRDFYTDLAARLSPQPIGAPNAIQEQRAESQVPDPVQGGEDIQGSAGRVDQQVGGAEVARPRQDPAQAVQAPAPVAKRVTRGEDRKAKAAQDARSNAAMEPGAVTITRPGEAPVEVAAVTGAPKADFSDNKLFPADAVAAARARLAKKRGTLNSGLDPETMLDAVTISGAHVESGVRSFARFSSEMVKDFGNSIKPYLRKLFDQALSAVGVKEDTAGTKGVKGSDAVSGKTLDEVSEEMRPVVADFMGWSETGEIDLEKDPLTLRQIEDKYGEVSHQTWKKRLAAEGFTHADQLTQEAAQRGDETAEGDVEEVVEGEPVGEFDVAGELQKDDEVLDTLGDTGTKISNANTETGRYWKTALKKELPKWREPDLAQASAAYMESGAASGISPEVFAKINQELGRREGVRLGGTADGAEFKAAETTDAKKTAAAQEVSDKESAEALEAQAVESEKQLPKVVVNDAKRVWESFTGASFSELTAVQRNAYTMKVAAAVERATDAADFVTYMDNVHASFLKVNGLESRYEQITATEKAGAPERGVQTVDAGGSRGGKTGAVAPATVQVKKSRKLTFSEAGAPKTQHTKATLDAVLEGLFRSSKRLADIVTVYPTHEAALAANPTMSEAKGSVAGFKTEDGKIGFVAENIEQGKELGIILHEIGVHLGMENLIGDAQMRRLVIQVRAWARTKDGSIESSTAILAMRRAAESSSPESKKDEEIIAYMVQLLVEGTPAYKGISPRAFSATALGRFLNRYVRAMKIALRKLGLRRTDFSGQNLVDMAYGAAELEMQDTSPVDTFYSQLARAIGEASDKVFTTGRATADWLQANHGSMRVKKEEMHWSGVLDWLQTQGKVSKADVLAFLDGNGVKVEEVVLGGEISPAMQKALDALDPVIGAHTEAELAWEDISARLGKSDAKVVAAKAKYDEFTAKVKKARARYEVEKAQARYESDFDTPAEAEFADRVPPGGKPGTYRELLLTLPTSDTAFWSSHFDQPNILAHLRVDEVEGANGERLLRVIEVQSDFGQEGEEKGFVGQRPKDKANLAEKKELLAKESDPTKHAAISKTIAKLEKRLRDGTYDIPVAPLVTDTSAWVSLAIKKAISYAAQTGMDGIVFATGQQNADLYDLEDGGEGMKAFYDKIVLETANKVLKQIGAGTKVSNVVMEKGGLRPHPDGMDVEVQEEPQPGFMLNDTIRTKSTSEGLPLFSEEPVVDEPETEILIYKDKAAFEAAKRESKSKDYITHAVTYLSSGKVRVTRSERAPASERAPSFSDDEKLRGSVFGQTVTNVRRYTKLAGAALEDLHTVVARVKKTLPSVDAWFKGMMDMRATRTEIELAADAVATLATKLSSASYKRVNAFIAAATMEQKWYEQPAWLGRTVVVDEKMADAWNGLSRKEQAVVDGVFRFGEESHTRMTKLFKDLGISDVFTQLGKLDGPYAPLKRDGEFVGLLKSKALLDAEAAVEKSGSKENLELVAKLKKDSRHFVSKGFGTMGMAQRFADHHAGAYASSAAFAASKRLGDPTSMGYKQLQKILAAVDANMDSLPEAAKAAMHALVKDIYMSEVDQASARQSGRTRQGTAGASENMVNSFLKHAKAHASFVASVAHGPEANAAYYRLQKEAKENKYAGQDDFALITNHYNTMLKYEPTPVADAVTLATTLYMLATNPAYHITNATQTVMKAVPKLAADFNDYSGAVKHLLKGYALMVKITTYGQNPDLSLIKDDGLRKALTAAARLRLLDVGIEEDLSHFGRLQSGYALIDGGSKVIGSAIHKLRQVSRTVEGWNRISTGAGAYTMAIAHGRTQEQAEAYAIESLVSTQGDVSRDTAPMVLKKLPKFTAQYKRFQFMSAALYSKAFSRAFTSADPAERAVGRRMLGYMMAHSFAAAGVRGSVLMPLIALLLWLSGDADDPRDADTKLTQIIEDAVGQGLATDVVQQGVLNTLGIDTSSKLGEQSLFSPAPYVTLDVTSGSGFAKMVAGVIGGASMSQLMRMADGLGLIGKGSTYKGVEKLVPKGAESVMKGFRLADEGVTRKNGDVILSPDDISSYELFITSIGGAPSRLQKLTRNEAVKYSVNKFYTDQTADITQRYVAASREGDRDTMADLKDRFRDLQASKDDVRYLFNDSRAELVKQPVSNLNDAVANAGKRQKKGLKAVVDP